MLRSKLQSLVSLVSFVRAMEKVRSLRRAWVLLAPALLAAAAFTQRASSPALPTDPRELVRLAVENDLRGAHSYPTYSFIFRKQKPEATLTEVMVGTTDGLAGRSIAVNDQPLSAQQQQEEDARLAGLVQDPARMREKMAKQRENLDRSIQIVSALPKAFLYDYDGWEQRGNEKLVRLTFRPDPKFDPPTRLEMVLTTMTGIMLIEPKLQHLASIDGTLQADVPFGWGILGHLDKGGHILLVQDDVGDGTWQQLHGMMNFTGKLLIFKSIDIKIDQTQSRFERVAAGMTFAQGVAWLNQHAAERAMAQVASKPKP